jgi:hypothetical protein
MGHILKRLPVALPYWDDGREVAASMLYTVCKLVQGAGNEGDETEENPEAAEEALEARGCETAFESAVDAAGVGS